MDTLRIKLVALVSYACLVSAGLFTLYSCNNRKLQESTPDEIAQYVEAYTASVVKRNSTIQIIFNENAEHAPAGSSRILKFSPSLKGQETWDSTGRKLTFVPDEGQLIGGDTYYCTVLQGKLIPGAKDIVFSFKVDEGTTEMEITEVRISTYDPETAIVRGKVTLSEPVYEEDIVVLRLFKTPTTWETVTTVDRIDDWTSEHHLCILEIRQLALKTMHKLIAC